ncbi:MAG: elongation factor 4 [candidate division Zixibacteria bacterium]|nr:elongation factor 4 [candidate division Zixibacteria bacterium]
MEHVKYIRNFSIIAHIDHGKSTLADRLLEMTRTINITHKQMLDSMDLEQERGITIKAHAIRMQYKANNGHTYILNLIDTPGHVDFSYEVSRSIAACEGALLVVDASQGIEAQTLSNLYKALDQNLEIIPVINKIDLPHAEPERVADSIENLIGCLRAEILMASAKQGIGIHEILEAIVNRIPPPTTHVKAPLRAMIFDSKFDSYRGAVPYIRVVDGSVKKGDHVRFFSTGIEYEVDEVGHLIIDRVPAKKLAAGEVGYLVCNIRNVSDAKVGDTITHAEHGADTPLPGFKEIKSMVYSGIYPATTERYDQLREALEKLKLNDASLTYEPESSLALGFGFRCGFLGLLHLEIVHERLEREFGVTIVNTVPNVEYHVHTIKGDVVKVDNPSKMPPPLTVDHIEEPFVTAQIITPTEYIGPIMKMIAERRGEFKATHYPDPSRATLEFNLPLSEIIFDFHDKLKSISRGYASLDYDFLEMRASKLVKLDILLNSEPVDALSCLIHHDRAQVWGRKLCKKLQELIPRQMFEVVIQAAIGSRIIARESVRPMRKNVTAKCYGGDISRKRKLLEKQKEGKKKMKQIGSVELPQEAFLAVLQIDRDGE